MMSQVYRILVPIRRALTAMIGRGLLKLIDDARDIQRVQIVRPGGAIQDSVERFQQYGFSSVPVADAEAILLCIGSNRDHCIVVAVDDRRYRPTGKQPGETMLYAKFGQLLLLKADGTVELTGASKFKVAGDLEVTGSISAGGDVADMTGTMAVMRTQYNTHTHIENGVPATPPTNPPLPPMT